MRARLTLATVLLVGVVGCGPPPAPAVAPGIVARPDTPIVFVPGISGTRLRDPRTGRVVWGNGSSLLRPRDRGHGTALPLAGESPLEPDGVIEHIRLAFLRKPVYEPIIRLLTDIGYRRGDIKAPRPDDTLFTFAFDWRRDNTTTARLLLERLEQVRRTRGEGRLRVALICQSGGAAICRYMLKFGDASLAEAEAGRAGPPRSIEATKLILLGPSGGGSLRILRMLNRGRRYVPLIGRRWQPETLFTFVSLYQDLPSYRSDLFVSDTGEALDIDVFDAAAWETFGWSVYGPDARRELIRGRRPDLFGDAAARAGFLREALERGRRFQHLLVADVEGFGDTEYHLIMNPHVETPARAVVIKDKDKEGGRWRTLFTGDPELKDRPRLHALATAPGDGHGTVESQLWLAPQELAAMVDEPFQVAGDHFAMLRDEATRRHILHVLRDLTP